MYTCEYDFTSQSLNRDELNRIVDNLFPDNYEVSSEMYDKMFDEFWTRDPDTINSWEYDNNSKDHFSFIWKHKRWFSYVMHPGLNGETWYYGFVIPKAQKVASITLKINNNE
jgi:hypothetical protein